MKHIVLCLLFLFLGFASTVNAQQSESQTGTATPAVVDEPEYSGAVYLLSGGKLMSLESQRPTLAIKSKALGFGSDKPAYVYTGSASPTRVASNAEFVMRLEGRADPVSLITLNKMKEKDDRRQLDWREKNGPKIIEVRFTKYGRESVKITAIEPFAPGEYAFRTASGVTYLFGVDPPDSK